MSCVARARANARSIRGTINSEMWRELNKLYWQLCDPAFSRQASESPHEFYQAVECGSCLFQGVCDATLNHDEGWQFIQLGKFLERADKTLRILDIQYHLLHDLTNPADLPLANLHWARRAAQLPGLRGVSAAVRRPGRAGARRRVPAAAPAVPALGPLLPGGGGRGAGGDRGAGRRPQAQRGRPRCWA